MRIVGPLVEPLFGAANLCGKSNGCGCGYDLAIPCPNDAALEAIILSERAAPPFGTNEMGDGTFACSHDCCGTPSCATDPGAIAAVTGRFAQAATGLGSAVVPVISSASAELTPH